MFYPLRRMGVQLSLWLCEDYDLIYHEENLNPMEEEDTGFPEDAEILDPHLIASVWQDKITKRDQRWFEHLKKFVDNGVQAFKLDGSNQVLAHPDRLWGSKYLDEEVHNVYPVLLVKDMQTGYKEYTDRRVLLNTAGAFTGTQKYAATWAGDTGGGPRTLVSVMNYAMCGHTNTSCDIDVHRPESTHYGFLMPWTQQNTWDYHYYPWYMGEEIMERVKFYTTLRSSLFPYIYAQAHTAYETGYPILRPLPLVYEKTDRFDGANNVYMLGDSLLVGAFDMHIPLPEGRWIDYFTGDVYEGGVDIDYKIPEGLGGALFVKSGDIVITMKPQKYILEKDHDYLINLYPDERASSAFIYEDDGFTYDYQNGGYTLTTVTSSGINNGSLTLTVKRREGGFEGRPDNGHDIINNSIPKIVGAPELRDMSAIIHGRIPSSVSLDGKAVEFKTEGDKTTFIIPAKLHEANDLEYVITF
jgi:alpha-glucosidase (family GH31 glycosyl hydrolase)